MSEAFSPLAGFNGMVRLFPLPNLVFFPQVMQPLHIFEPRYRQMTADALAGDRLIALVLPRPGWEKEYATGPPLHAVATLGKIVADQKLDDGRYNILLKGLGRVQILHEIPHSKLYRKAKVELLAEVPLEAGRQERKWRKKLGEQVPHWFAGQDEVLDQFRKLLKTDLALGAVCDILAFALPLDVEFKQALLEELEVEQRLKMLTGHVEIQAAAKEAAPARKFPPEFSSN